LRRGIAWLDAGTPASLLQAANSVQTIGERQGLTIDCLGKIAWCPQWIGDDEFRRTAEAHGRSGYAA